MQRLSTVRGATATAGAPLGARTPPHPTPTLSTEAAGQECEAPVRQAGFMLRASEPDTHPARPPC